VASLAGYRGLPKAGAYGATKAALINLTEALKPEADLAGIRLRLINPGFVETPLTAQNDFPMPFLIPVERAVKFILDGLAGEQFEIAFPRRFTWVMKLLRLLPNSLFFSLTRRMVS
jgi:short-subunit dehydrogenase